MRRIGHMRRCWGGQLLAPKGGPPFGDWASAGQGGGFDAPGVGWVGGRRHGKCGGSDAAVLVCARRRLQPAGMGVGGG